MEETVDVPPHIGVYQLVHHTQGIISTPSLFCGNAGVQFGSALILVSGHGSASDLLSLDPAPPNNYKNYVD